MAHARRGSPIVRTEVAASALAIVDRKGLDGLSMRSLAAELSCSTMALYRHVDHRRDLLQLVQTQVLAEIVPLSGEKSDSEWFRAIGEAIRIALSQHPNTTPLLVSSVPLSSSDLSMLDGAAERLLARGVPPSALAGKLNAFFGGLLGYLCLEFAPPTGELNEPVDLDERLRAYQTLHRLRNTLRNKVFGIRSGTVLIPRSGYDELLGALVNSLLHQPERKSST
jgi:AcrR family transcriptional regulator